MWNFENCWFPPNHIARNVRKGGKETGMKYLTKNSRLALIGFVATVALVAMLAVLLSRPGEKKSVTFFEPDWSLTYEEALVAAGEGASAIPDSFEPARRSIFSKENSLEAFGMSGSFSFEFEGDTLIQMYYFFDLPITNYASEKQIIIDVENYLSTLYKPIQRFTPRDGAKIGYRVNFLSEVTNGYLAVMRSSKPDCYDLLVRFANEKYCANQYNKQYQKPTPTPQAKKVDLQVPTVSASGTEK